MADVSPNLDALAGCEILVGVSGGIAAYKAAYLVSALARAGAGVSVVMTASAKRFVTPLLFHALSGRPAFDDLWTAPEGHPAPHIALAERAEVVAVAPATADLLAKAAHGIADDLLTSTLLAVEAPLVLAPAMNERMWKHPAVQANCEALRGRGAALVGPKEGRLACGEEGTGRMAEPDEILAAIARALEPRA
ncbi:MAG: flavoprotein [Planctomycetota bacterium]|nr:flavoprotein [Planctomycetota bacterium]